MRRRDFLIASAVLASGQRSSAQPVASKKRMALVHPSTKIADMRIGGDSSFTIVLQELERLGFVEGRNLVIDRYSAEGQTTQYGDIAREIVSTHPDVIATSGTPITLKLKALTSTIPVVAITGDPIRFGVVSSLAHPGGNVTGVSVDAGPELWGKRVELLAEAVPKLRRMFFVGSQASLEGVGGKATREVAQKLGIALVNVVVLTPINEQTYRRTFDALKRDQADGLVFSNDTESYAHRVLLVELVQQIGVPAIYVFREQAEAGGLMSYSADLKSALLTSAGQIVEILHGANPGELPYVLATRFELVINVKTAKTLDLEVPATLLARADKVIE